jgi:hypothetical protein
MRRNCRRTAGGWAMLVALPSRVRSSNEPEKSGDVMKMERVLLSMIGIVVFGLLIAIPASSAAGDATPNVVVLLADDLGWADVGYHGGEIETPSIDRIAREGVELDRFYAAPICSPTRAALMTGRDPPKVGIANDQIHPWYSAGLSPNELTIADVSRSDGYQTGLVGKWHLGHTLAHQVPNAQGFDHFWGHLHTNTDFYTHQREGAHDLQENGKSVYEPNQYLTHLEAREAQRFIRDRDPARPFFLYVPFTAPHSPMQAPQSTIDKYESLSNKASRRVYAAMVDELDQAIGAILDALDDEGIADNTIVLFMSDNGGSSVFGGVNTPLRGEKVQTFEGGIRVPAAIRFPKELEARSRRTVGYADARMAPPTSHGRYAGHPCRTSRLGRAEELGRGRHARRAPAIRLEERASLLEGVARCDCGARRAGRSRDTSQAPRRGREAKEGPRVALRTTTQRIRVTKYAASFRA